MPSFTLHSATRRACFIGTSALASRQIIETLVVHGVSPDIEDSSGKSLLDWARSEWIRELLASEAGKSMELPPLVQGEPSQNDTRADLPRAIVANEGIVVDSR